MILETAVEDGLIERNPLQSKRLKITGRASQITEPYTQDEMRYIARNLDKIEDSSEIRYNNFRKLKSKQKKTWFAVLW
jgi:hypothetical protein